MMINASGVNRWAFKRQSELYVFGEVVIYPQLSSEILHQKKKKWEKKMKNQIVMIRFIIIMIILKFL